MRELHDTTALAFGGLFHATTRAAEESAGIFPAVDAQAERLACATNAVPVYVARTRHIHINLAAVVGPGVAERAI